MTRHGKKHKLKAKSGATLVEGLVSTAILGLVITGVLLSYVRSLEMLEISQNMSRSLRDAQAQMEAVRSDITGASPMCADPSSKLQELAGDAENYYTALGEYPPSCEELYNQGYTATSCSALDVGGYKFYYSKTTDGFSFTAEPRVCRVDCPTVYFIDQDEAVSSESCGDFVSSSNRKGFVYVESVDNNFYEVQVSVCWRNKNGRVYGEDANFNGVLDAGEDANGNGRVDSPASLISRVFKR
ncbi:MAG: hypothetical protein ACLFPX_00555 [Candidatus Omnitrophota bacterium]